MRRLKLAAVITLAALAPLLMAPTGNAPAVPAVIGCNNITTCSATGLKIGQAICANSTTSNSRASTTTQTDDPNLKIANVPIGAYYLSWQIIGQAGAGGFNFTNSFGWVDAGQSQTQGTSVIETGVLATFGFASNAIGWLGANGFVSHSVSAAGVGFMNYTIAGTVSILWAQSVSNAANSTVQGGGICLTRLN